MSGDSRRDDGVGTVLALGVVAALGVVLVVLGLLGGALQARQRARTAADLAALAGATALSAGAPDPCAVARRSADAGGAALVRCRAGPGVQVLVEVTVPVPRAVARATGRPVAAASARAGEAGAGP